MWQLAKFRGDWPRERGDLALNKRKKERKKERKKQQQNIRARATRVALSQRTALIHVQSELTCITSYNTIKQKLH